LRRSNAHWFECHAAFWTGARFLLHHFRVHWTGIGLNYLSRSTLWFMLDRLRSRHFGRFINESFRIFAKLSQAMRAAEVVGFTIVLMETSGGVWTHCHAANGISNSSL